MLKLLFLGDIIGEPGRRAVIESVPKFREHRGVDFVVVNGENAAAGRGITPKISIDLLRAGIAVITSGDHIWDQREITPYLDTEPRLLRPINYPDGTPGTGSVVLELAHRPGVKVAVMNVQGRTFMNPPLENPFLVSNREIARLREQTPVIFVDVHAETTSEKIALGRFLDGRVSAVVGLTPTRRLLMSRFSPGGRHSFATPACVDRQSPAWDARSNQSSNDS
jgi:metallophosphoesterase (TIGR00282 family)